MSGNINPNSTCYIDPAAGYHAVTPSAPPMEAPPGGVLVADLSPPSYQASLDVKTDETTRRIFDRLCFLPSEKSETKKYWTEFSGNIISSLTTQIDNSRDEYGNLTDRSFGSEAARFLLCCTVVVPIYCLAKHYFGQYMASRIEVYDTPEAWKAHRTAAADMDFEQLTKRYGLERVRRLRLLGNTPDEGIKLVKEKFDAFLKSDEVVARKWVTGLASAYDETGSFQIVEKGTPWGRFISTKVLKDEGIIEQQFSGMDICFQRIPKNDKRLIEVGRMIQNLTFQEFGRQFSERQLRKEGALLNYCFYFDVGSYNSYKNLIGSIILKIDRLDA